MLLELEEASSWGDPQLEIALGYVFAGASSWMGYKFPLLSKSDFSGLGKIGPTSGTFTSSNRQHGFRFSFFHMDTPDMCSKKPTSCAASCGKLRCLVPPSDDSRLEKAFLLVQLAAGLFSPPCQIAKAEAEAGARLRLAEVFWLKSWEKAAAKGEQGAKGHATRCVAFSGDGGFCSSKSSSPVCLGRELGFRFQVKARARPRFG